MKTLREAGIPDELKQVRSPSTIAAGTSGIAVSIMAEIIMLRQGGDGSVMAAGN
jgi:xanthine/CO dehydrogenase XdhC/CoxF family maturation factor